MRGYAAAASAWLAAAAVDAAPAVQPPPFVLVGGEAAFERETVRDLPYSARTETGFVHRHDGNLSAGRWTGFVARDGAGRIRRELPLAAIGSLVSTTGSPRLTVIHDPVQRITLFLDAASRTARRMPWSEGTGGPQFLAWYRLAAADLPATAKTVTESLGSREIAGHVAQGTRSRYVVGALEAGDALEVVSERWRSEQLRALVETKLSDPGRGEVTYKLVEIDIGEPDPALFAVPPGYAIEDGTPPLNPPLVPAVASRRPVPGSR